MKLHYIFSSSNDTCHYCVCPRYGEANKHGVNSYETDLLNDLTSTNVCFQFVLSGLVRISSY